MIDKRILGFGLWFGVIAVALSSGACFGSPGPNHEFHNFQTVAAGAPAEGWTPYWLGRSFHAAGATFSGPSVPDFGNEIEGGGVISTYDTHLARGGVGLEIAAYSQTAWAKARDAQTRFPKDAIRSTATVAGQPAQVVLIPAGTRPVDEARVYVELGDTMIVVIAGSGGSATPGGPDLNPLIDEQTFLSVLQNLRPYPQ